MIANYQRIGTVAAKWSAIHSTTDNNQFKHWRNGKWTNLITLIEKIAWTLYLAIAAAGYLSAILGNTSLFA